MKHGTDFLVAVGDHETLANVHDATPCEKAGEGKFLSWLLAWRMQIQSWSFCNNNKEAIIFGGTLTCFSHMRWVPWGFDLAGAVGSVSWHDSITMSVKSEESRDKAFENCDAGNRKKSQKNATQLTGKKQAV